MKKQSVVAAVVMAALLAVLYSVSALAVSVPSPSEGFYVYDGANVISKETENYIINRNTKLNDKTDGQIVIVTVNTTDDVKIGEYADTIFSQWKIGDSEKKNGLLLLLAIDDENYWVTPGSGIEHRLSSANLKTMLDNFLEPHFASGDYDKGVSTVFDKFVSSYESMYSIDLDAVETGEDGTVEAKADGSTSSKVITVLAVIAAVVIFVVAAATVVRKMNSVRRPLPASSPRRNTNRQYGNSRDTRYYPPQNRPAQNRNTQRTSSRSASSTGAGQRNSGAPRQNTHPPRNNPNGGRR